MTLIKKTIVLSKNGARGYVTVVRVGSDVGAKIVIDYSGEKALIMGLKIGSNELIVRKIKSPRTEIELGKKVSLDNSDDLSCVILLDEKIYAEGGFRERINLQEVLKKSKYELGKKEASHGQDKESFEQNKNLDSKSIQKDKTVVKAEEARRVETKIKTSKEENTAILQGADKIDEDKIEKAQAQESAMIDKDKINQDKVVKDKINKKEQNIDRGKSILNQLIVENIVLDKEITKEKEVENKKVEQEEADSLVEESDSNQDRERQMPKDFAKEAKSFYYSVKDKLDDLFVMYPKEELLEKIIPSSKWVRINYDKDDYYVAGVLIDDENLVSHIGYGVPGFEGKSPPKEAVCICDWLPIKNMEKYQGYWLIFQSADTGEILSKD